MEPLKNRYHKKFFNDFSKVLEKTVSGFDRKQFLKLIFTKEWKDLELKDRMKHIAVALHEFMPKDFSKAATIIEKTTEELLENGGEKLALEYMLLPEYIEKYGIEHPERAMKAMETVTTLSSCEFTIRPFILKYNKLIISQLRKWTKHKNHHIRRLASEGCRPRLPWAMALPPLKNDPTPILPILENLKNDPSEYVRRSVANNINDIAKDNPDMVIAIAKKWKGISKETDWVIKHGSRTLLKQGHPEILKYYGLGHEGLEVSNFKIQTPKVAIGEYLEFSFTLKNTDTKPRTVRLEYGLYYLKKNGQHNRKVFKISERELADGEVLEVKRKQSFKLISTRVFYVGAHRLSVIVNGAEKGELIFELIELNG